MMFIDRTRIRVEAGHGGRGSASFRREKFVPKGGPDGGNGVRAAMSWRADFGEQSLVALRFKPEWKAERGGDGGSRHKNGAGGKPCQIIVPVGTLVFEQDSGELLCDLKEEGQEFVAARGGRGGKGNMHYVSSVNRSPRQFQPGEEGEMRNLLLVLKTVADVGLLGLPNAGKSTFLRAVTAARPKTASYPFTTRHPNVGVVEMEDWFRFTIADIPGLLEGAHQNLGLGHEFLRHIERCRILCYVLDMGGTEGRDPLDDLQVLRTELEHYEPGLTKRPSIIVANKMDLPEAQEALQKLLEQERQTEVIPVCAELSENTDAVISSLRRMIESLPEEDEEQLSRLLAKLDRV